MYDLGPELDRATLAPGSNLLVAGPPLSGKRRLAMSVLATGARAGDGSIVVTTRDSSERVVSDFRRQLGPSTEFDLGVVDCVTRHQGRPASDSDRVKYASSPVDMTGIGMLFSEFLERFYAERGLVDNRVMVDSVSSLLVYADLETVFRFLHAVTGRIEDAEALGVFVVESTAHDEEALRTLEQLFDGVVETDEDGTVAVDVPDHGAPVAGR